MPILQAVSFKTNKNKAKQDAHRCRYLLPASVSSMKSSKASVSSVANRIFQTPQYKVVGALANKPDRDQALDMVTTVSKWNFKKYARIRKERVQRRPVSSITVKDLSSLAPGQDSQWRPSPLDTILQLGANHYIPGSCGGAFFLNLSKQYICFSFEPKTSINLRPFTCLSSHQFNDWFVT